MNVYGSSELFGSGRDVECVEALKLLTGHEGDCVPGLLVVDGWAGEVDRITVARAPACPCCAGRQFPWLEGGAVSEGIVLCGRDAVQVPGRPGARVRFDELAASLAPLGTVRYNEHLLRFSTADHDVSLFPDGRAIIKGTSDPAVARSLYSRYFGM